MAFRFLTDENMSKSLVRELRDNGHNVKDIKEEKLFGAPDKEILNMAKAEDRIILTHDKDFSNILDFPLQSHNGIILIRYKDLSPDNVINKFVPLLDTELKNKLKKHLVIIADNFIKTFKAKD